VTYSPLPQCLFVVVHHDLICSPFLGSDHKTPTSYLVVAGHSFANHHYRLAGVRIGSIICWVLVFVIGPLLPELIDRGLHKGDGGPGRRVGEGGEQPKVVGGRKEGYPDREAIHTGGFRRGLAGGGEGHDGSTNLSRGDPSYSRLDLVCRQRDEMQRGRG
jgi:hypothetical protein